MCKKIYGQWPEVRKSNQEKKFECRETHHVKNIYEEFLKSPDELRKEKGQPFIKWISGCLQYILSTYHAYQRKIKKDFK